MQQSKFPNTLALIQETKKEFTETSNYVLVAYVTSPASIARMLIKRICLY